MKTIVKRPDGSLRVSISFPEDQFILVNRMVDGKREQYKHYPAKSVTKAEFAKEAGMKNIMDKYARTGFLGDPARSAGFYGDFSSGEDFSSMMRKVANAQSRFSELPAEIRSRFGNDPAQLVSFLLDKRNDAEAIELGLKAKPVPVKPAPVAAAPDPAGGAPVTPPVAPPSGNVQPPATPGATSGT